MNFMSFRHPLLVFHILCTTLSIILSVVLRKRMPYFMILCCFFSSALLFFGLYYQVPYSELLMILLIQVLLCFLSGYKGGWL